MRRETGAHAHRAEYEERISAWRETGAHAHRAEYEERDRRTLTGLSMRRETGAHSQR